MPLESVPPIRPGSAVVAPGRFPLSVATVLPLLLVLLGATPARALLAWGEESFGSAPVGPNREWPDGLLALANDAHRVYRSWVNGNENFFFTGDDKALGAFLDGFALVKLDVREVIILPVPGRTRSFEGKPVTFSWRLHAPSGIYLAHVLGEVDSNVTVRKPTVFIHVAGDIKLSDLRIPKELSVLGPDDMVLRARRGLESKQPDVRGQAAFLLHEHAYVEGAVDALAGLVGDPEESAALSAARALGLCGKRAAKAVEALRRRAEKAGERLAKECRDAAAAIEAASPLDETEEKRIRDGLKAIRALVESRRRSG